MSTTFTRGENPLRADKLNTAFSERVSRGGDTMQGRLTLAGDPVAAFDAATKQYVDRFTSMGVPTGAYIGSAPPGNVLGPLWWDNVSGQLFIQYNDGSSTQWVSANSIDASTLEGSFLSLAGGTMQGPVILAGNATSPLHAVPLQQLSAATAGGPFLPLTGGVLSGSLSLADNATQPLHAVPLQQLTATTSGFLSLTGGTLTGPLQIGLTGTNNALTITSGATTSDPVTMMVDNAVGSLAINGPLLLQTTAPTSATQLIMTNYYPTAGNVIIGDTRGGTPGAPTSTSSNRPLLSLQGRGYFTGGTTGIRAQINFNSAVTFSATSQPTYIDFQVTPSGSLVMASAMRLNNNGQLTIGTAGPVGSSKLYVSGDATFVSNTLNVSGTAGTTTLNVTPPSASSGRIVIGNPGNILSLTCGAIQTDPNIIASGYAGGLRFTDSKLNLPNLPTSAAGLVAGDMWRNGTVVNIV